MSGGLRIVTRMTLEEIEADLPILETHLDAVVRRMERTRAKRKVSRRELILTFMATRSIPATARAHGVSDSLVGQLLSRACYMARRCAGLWPPPQAREPYEG
jgi:hypothetical protein